MLVGQLTQIDRLVYWLSANLGEAGMLVGQST